MLPCYPHLQFFCTYYRLYSPLYLRVKKIPIDFWIPVYEHFTPAFWLQKNFCEFTLQEHKFKGWYCTQKPDLNFVLNISSKQKNLSQKYIIFNTSMTPIVNAMLLHMSTSCNPLCLRITKGILIRSISVNCQHCFSWCDDIVI